MNYYHYQFRHTGDLVEFLNNNKINKSEIISIHSDSYLEHLIILTDRDWKDIEN